MSFVKIKKKKEKKIQTLEMIPESRETSSSARTSSLRIDDPRVISLLKRNARATCRFVSIPTALFQRLCLYEQVEDAVFRGTRELMQEGESSVSPAFIVSTAKRFSFLGDERGDDRRGGNDTLFLTVRRRAPRRLSPDDVVRLRGFDCSYR